MGIIPDAIINLVLMVAFGVYCVMGLSFFIMGIVYMGDAGAIGSTGIYLIFLGLLMLIIGGIALWANMNSNWMVLFIIELINVALFLVRMCARVSHIRVRACEPYSRARVQAAGTERGAPRLVPSRTSAFVSISHD